MIRKYISFIFLSAILGVSWLIAAEKSEQGIARSKPAAELTISSAELRLLARNGNELTLEWRCPPYSTTRDSVTGAILGFEVEGAQPLIQRGVPTLPQLQQLLDVLPGAVRLFILEEELETAYAGTMLASPDDEIVDPRPDASAEFGSRSGLDESPERLSYLERALATPKLERLWPEQSLQIAEAGVYRGHRLVNINFTPLRVHTANGTLRFTKRIKFRVILPNGNDEPRDLDRPNETALVENLLGPLKSTALRTRAHPPIEHSESGRLDEDPIGGRIKLFVKQEGITRVTAEWLQFQLIDYAQITTQDLHVKNKGREIPVHFQGGGDNHWDEFDYLEFYSHPNESTYTAINPSLLTDPWSNENVYWLSWGDGIPGMRLGEEDGSWHPEWRPTPINSVRSFVHLEKDRRFDRLGELVSSNPFFEARLTANGPLGAFYDHYFMDNRIDARSTRDYAITLPSPNLESLRPVFVRACLNGFSYGGGSFGHHRAIVYLNGHTERGLAIGRIAGNPDTAGTWTNQTPVIIESDPVDPGDPGISGQDLQDGDNIISVTLPGDGLAGDNDKIYANWFDVEYDRQPRAAGGFLRFRVDTTRGDTFSFDLRGFSTRGIQVWKLGEARLMNCDIRFNSKADEGQSFWVRFPLISDGAYEFFVFEDRAVTFPERAEWETSTRDLRTLTGSEYLMIAHDRFRTPELSPAISMLDSMRKVSFNGSADTIWVSQIYEQFNWGIVSPEAIRNFLQYAYEHWTVRPTHACLVGDGIAQIHEYEGSGNMIPPFFPLTKEIGAAACDGIYGMISGPPWDLIMDVAVGRISARTPEELESYVDKVRDYEAGASYGGSKFRSTFMFVADQKDAIFNFLRDFSEPTIRQTPNFININRVYLDSLRRGEGPTALRDAFRDGAVVVNYNGHGGGGVWSGTSLIDVAGVRLLTNRGLFPFITNFTCYVGAFDDLNQAAVLGEAFIFSDNNSGFHVGGVAVYSSSGVGWANEGVGMQRFMFDFLGQERGLTIGEIVQISKARHWASRTEISGRLTNGVPYYMQMMMNLLGDPGIVLDLPHEHFDPDIQGSNYVVRIGDSLRVVGTLPWANTDGHVVDLFISPYNGDHFSLLRINDTTIVSRFSTANWPAFDPVRDFTFTEQFITAQNFVSNPLPITSRFFTPRGHVVVYATDAAERRDAVGWFPIFSDTLLDTVRIYDLRAVPAGYVQNDTTFRVHATILHEDGLEQVKFRGVYRPLQGPLVLDTLNMVQTGPGEWETGRDLGPYNTLGASYRVTLYVKPNGGEFYTSPDYTLPLEGLPDFSVPQVQPIVPRLESGTRANFVVPILYSKLPNAPVVDALQVRIEGTRDSLLANGTRVVVDSFTTNRTIVDPGQFTSLFEQRIELYFRPGLWDLRVLLDPLNRVPETNESNNNYNLNDVWATMFPATNVLGTFYTRPTEPTIFHSYRSADTSRTDTLSVRIAPGSFLADTATLVYSGPFDFPAGELADLRQSGLISPYTTSQPHHYFHAMLGDSGEALSGEANVSVRFSLQGIADTTRIRHLRDLSIFQRRKESGVWHRLENTDLDTFVVQPFRGRLNGTARSLGDFAIFYYIDDVGPRISFTVSGEHFTKNSFVPRRPEIFINFADVGGIDRGAGKNWIVLDGDTIPEADIAWSDSLEAGGNMSALIRPDLDPGTHHVTAFGTDNSGNSTSESADFTVRGDFGIEWAINYPNPFKAQTTISFVLTDLATDLVTIKIYTVSGRHIRTLRSLDRQLANYQFLIWDGRDETGEEVANGVYFAKIIVKHDDEEVEKLVKMAKLR